VAIDPLTYPEARARRDGPAPPTRAAIPGVAPSPPRSRVFPFSLDVTALNRTSVSSPRLKGPALITGIHVTKGSTPKGLQGFGLGVAVSPVSEANVGVTSTFPFRPLFEGLPNPTSVPSSPGNTTAIIDMQGAILLDVDRLNIIVLEPEFYLVVYVAAGTTGTDDFMGFVTLLEQVSPEALANFL